MVWWYGLSEKSLMVAASLDNISHSPDDSDAVCSKIINTNLETLGMFTVLMIYVSIAFRFADSKHSLCNSSKFLSQLCSLFHISLFE
jgi:hypothetical protein